MYVQFTSFVYGNPFGIIIFQTFLTLKSRYSEMVKNPTVEPKVNKFLFYITPLVLKSYTFGYDVEFRNIPLTQISVPSGSKGSIILLNT